MVLPWPVLRPVASLESLVMTRVALHMAFSLSIFYFSKVIGRWAWILGGDLVGCMHGPGSWEI